MDELMSMMNQLADGETAQVAQSVQEIMQESIVPAVAAVVLGLVICFFGLKLIRVLAAITGICIGAVAGAALALVFGLQGTAVLAASAVGAVLFACLGAILRRVGGFLFIWVLTAGVLEWFLAPGTVPFHLICLGVGLVIAVITAILMDPIIIVLSSVGGGIVAGLAVSALPGLDLNILLTYGICAVLAILGIVVQFMMKSREVGKKEKRYSESVKEEKSVETEVEKARMLLEDDPADLETNLETDLEADREPEEKTEEK